MDVVYAIAGVPLVPWLILKSRRTGKYRTGLAQRFGLGNEALPTPADRAGRKTLLLHCVSVGELNSVQTLIRQLLAADPSLLIIVTTTTDTGWERATKLYGSTTAGSTQTTPDIGGTPMLRRVFPVRFPFDFSFAMERLFDRVRPDAVALVELETWPNFLDIVQDRRIPVMLINGRISQRSFPRYRLIWPVMASMLRKITWIGAQTDTIASRFRHLGANNVEVIPTLKYDNATLADRVPGQEALAAAMGLFPEHRLFVAGSIGPGEEEPLLDAYTALREKHPDLRLALVPRHPEVVLQVIRAIERRGLTPILRTNCPDPQNGTRSVSEAPGPIPHHPTPFAQATHNLPNEDHLDSPLETRNPKLETHHVFLLNTMGELRKLYALAFAVFVGRSLVKLGGSDMIEVAALAKPSCFGPHTHNFAEAVELLTTHNAAIIVQDAESLRQTLSQWLTNPAAAQSMGHRAQDLIRRQQGSTQHYVHHLLASCTVRHNG